MDRFIHEQNVAHFNKVLSETTDPTKRHTVLKLLADEMTKDRVSSRVAASGGERDFPT